VLIDDIVIILMLFLEKHPKNFTTILIYYIAIVLNGALKLTCQKTNMVFRKRGRLKKYKMDIYWRRH
jgi:hypothetical protein